jgi:acyl dehydratase
MQWLPSEGRSRVPAVKTVDPPNLFFEDFAEGQEFATVTKGPMMVGHQVRWAGACDNYDSEFHHDEQVAKAQGLPTALTIASTFRSARRPSTERTPTSFTNP